MKRRAFLDTNILVYADDLDAGKKRKRAQSLLRGAITSGNAVVSTQVLQEFFVVATRKLGVKPEVARLKLELLAGLDVINISVELILGAIDLHRLNGISFWDALIVKSASAAGCAELWTEDLQHHQVIDNVQIVNPFA